MKECTRWGLRDEHVCWLRHRCLTASRCECHCGSVLIVAKPTILAGSGGRVAVSPTDPAGRKEQ